MLFSTLRGESEKNREHSNEFFSAALIGTAILAAITRIVVVFFDKGLLTLFGAEENASWSEKKLHQSLVTQNVIRKPLQFPY